MDTPEAEEVDRLRAQVAEWRRRAEVAEAVASERLIRAETAEKALDSGLAARPPADAGGTTGPAGVDAEQMNAEPVAADATARPRTLRQRWRRYIDSVN